MVRWSCYTLFPQMVLDSKVVYLLSIWVAGGYSLWPLLDDD